MKSGTLQMKNLLAPACIALDAPISGREQAVHEIARLFADGYGLRHADVGLRLWRREHRQSTGVGYGLALPHADVAGLTRPVAAFLRVKHAIAFDAPDRAPVRDLLALLVPRPASAGHFDLLAHYRQLLSRPQFRVRLAACTDAGAVWQLFEQHEWR
jgi:PTS system nitrogen regulatory IIA component